MDYWKKLIVSTNWLAIVVRWSVVYLLCTGQIQSVLSSLKHEFKTHQVRPVVIFTKFNHFQKDIEHQHSTTIDYASGIVNYCFGKRFQSIIDYEHDCTGLLKITIKYLGNKPIKY